MKDNKPKNIEPSNEKKYVDGPVDADEAKYLSAIKDKETQLSLGEILKSILEIENHLNSLNSEHDFDAQLEELKEIKEKFKEYLKACKECEDFLDDTDHGMATSKKNLDAMIKAEYNIRKKYKDMDTILEVLKKYKKL